MALFVIASESRWEMWWFFDRNLYYQLYDTDEMSSQTYDFDNFFLKKVIYCKKFDNIWYPDNRDPWDFGKNGNEIGSDSKNWFKFKEFEYKIDYNWWHILTYFLTVYGWMFRGSPTDH